MVALWLLAGTVGRLGNLSTVLRLFFFLVTVVKPSCAVKLVVLHTDCVQYALFPDAKLEEEITLLTFALAVMAF
jgi:hypothetical protein